MHNIINAPPRATSTDESMESQPCILALRRYARLAAILLVAAPIATVSAAAVINDFDSTGGETYLGGASAAGNFVTTVNGLNPTAGSMFFVSGNGSSTTTFQNVGISKDLGGSMANESYSVYVNFASYSDNTIQPLTFSDFDTLSFGSGLGITQWTSTPNIVNKDTWYTWTGTFTPHSSDIGTEWRINIQFDLPPKHDIAIDLPQTGFAVAVPEPATSILVAVTVCFGFISRRRQR